MLPAKLLNLPGREPCIFREAVRIEDRILYKIGNGRLGAILFDRKDARQIGCCHHFRGKADVLEPAPQQVQVGSLCLRPGFPYHCIPFIDDKDEFLLFLLDTAQQAVCQRGFRGQIGVERHQVFLYRIWNHRSNLV